MVKSTLAKSMIPVGAILVVLMPFCCYIQTKKNQYKVEALFSALAASDPEDLAYGVSSQEMCSDNNTPLYVQEYLHTAINNVTYKACTRISFRQQGSILVGKRWLPFEAKQVISARPIGFVWAAQVYATDSSYAKLLPNIHVCDAYVNNTGHVLVTVGNVFSLSTVDKVWNEELLVGEMLRWMAELFLLPPSLLPERNLVSWQETLVPYEATIGYKQHSLQKRITLQVRFDDKLNLPIEVEGIRPAATNHGFVNRQWRGYFSEYKSVAGYMIPTHLECGWISNDGEELYFKGDIIDPTFS